MLFTLHLAGTRMQDLDKISNRDFKAALIQLRMDGWNDEVKEVAENYSLTLLFPSALLSVLMLLMALFSLTALINFVSNSSSRQLFSAKESLINPPYTVEHLAATELHKQHLPLVIVVAVATTTTMTTTMTREGQNSNDNRERRNKKWQEGDRKRQQQRWEEEEARGTRGRKGRHNN